MEKLGNLLLKYIELNNYTQTAFAKKMNISLSTLNKYILNKRQIPLDNLIRFAKELDFSLDYALGILNDDSNKILYLIFDYPHKHYTFKYFKV